MAPKWRGPQAAPEPEGELRSSQVVTTFGPGALVDLIDDAVLIGGLDAWRYLGGGGGATVYEPRLRDAIAGRLEARGIRLNREAPFREPPVQGDAPDKRHGIPVAEFPRWMVCQNPKCRALVEASQALPLKQGRYHHDCEAPGGPERCVAVRFVAACKKGHLDELPWRYFVHEHNGLERCGTLSLSLEEGVTGDFSTILVRCRCGASRPLSKAMSDEANPRCSGRRPWLGTDSREECEGNIRLLVRTASNGYFAQVESSLWLPDEVDPLVARIDAVRDVLSAETQEADLPVLLRISKVRQAVGSASPAEVWRALQKLHQATGEREPIRTAEYRRLIAQPVELAGELPPREARFFARAVKLDPPPPRVKQVVLASKLREVRVQVGFTRLEPRSPNLQGEYDLEVESAPLGLSSDWLPATEIRGEGIFVQLDEEAVSDWERLPAVQQRSKALEAAAARHGEEFPGAGYYLLHSLSHLLINALSLECGYPASSIRERIYRSLPNEPPMAGLLLMTGSSGTEGTLGGLVEQGRRLAHHFERAIDLARLCSNDPVCAFHQPGDPSDRPLEGAACHGCLFIAECSCERFNRFLDRALIVPTLGSEDAAFWRSER